jgi:hypothetical protein
MQFYPHRFLGIEARLEFCRYGGVSASYAFQADIKVAISSARIGFAGPGVILNTARADSATLQRHGSAEATEGRRTRDKRVPEE